MFSLGGQKNTFLRTSAVVAPFGDKSRKAEALETLQAG